MGRNWRILRAAVEQEILFPNRKCFEDYIESLKRNDHPFQVLDTTENADGTLTVLMRKRYNPGNAFLEKEREEK